MHDDGKPNYNPFHLTWGRLNLSSSHDVEKGPQAGKLTRGGTYQSADYQPQSTEINRISQYEPDHIGPPHAQTMPHPEGGAGPQSSGLESTHPGLSRVKEAKERSEDSSATRSDTLVPDDQAAGRSQPRQRKVTKLLGKLHMKHSENDTIDSVRTPTGSTKSPKKKYTFASQIRATVLNSWINVLLVAAPVGIVLHVIKVNPVAVFVVNFIAIIPLAAMLSFATEEIALRTGETIGGLLNASFG